MGILSVGLGRVGQGVVVVEPAVVLLRVVPGELLVPLPLLRPVRQVLLVAGLAAAALHLGRPGHPQQLIAVKRGGGSGPARARAARQALRQAASSNAWPAPWARNGNMGWAESPSSAMRPALHRASGSRSSSGQRVAAVDAASRSVSRESQPSNWATSSGTSPVATQVSGLQSRAGAVVGVIATALTQARFLIG